jgi:hypothetical protein
MLFAFPDSRARARTRHGRLGFCRRAVATGAFAFAAMIFGGVLFGVPAPARAQETLVVGDIGRVVGSVTVLRGEERLTARSGSVVREGDGLVTGAESKAEILCADGSTLVVGPDSTVSMASFAAEPGGTGLLDLISGILRVTLSGRTPWHYFEVRSATAVASVRSTDWVVDATRIKTGVFVIDGTVAVASRQGAEQGAGEVTLTAGQGTDVAINATPTPPKAWGQKRVDDVLARTTMP